MNLQNFPLLFWAYLQGIVFCVQKNTFIFISFPCIFYKF